MRLYEIVQGVAEDKVDVDADATAAVVDERWKRINDFAPVFRHLARLEERWASLHGTVAARDEHIAELSQIVAERDLQVTATNQTFGEPGRPDDPGGPGNVRARPPDRAVAGLSQRALRASPACPIPESTKLITSRH